MNSNMVTPENIDCNCLKISLLRLLLYNTFKTCLKLFALGDAVISLFKSFQMLDPKQRTDFPAISFS